MPFPHPITDPLDAGVLDVGDGHRVFWEISGNRSGKPAVLLHGGPGGGSSPRQRRMFDPERYLIVQFDQRNCGRSTPHAASPVIDLRHNTTGHLVGDIERLRAHLGIDRWLVWGGSWGTTLALAYGQTHPDAVSELLLSAVTTTSRAEVEWLTRSMGRVFPERWERFIGALAPHERDGDLAGAYHRLLINPDPLVHEPAAVAWCEWEDTHVSLPHGHQPDLGNQGPAFRLAFSRLVTHYWTNAGFLDDGQLIRDAGRLSGIPTFLLHGRMDVSSPADTAVTLAKHLPDAELFIAEREGHGGPALSEHTTLITDRLAT